MAFGRQLRAGLKVSVPGPPGADLLMELGRDLEHRRLATGQFGKKKKKKKKLCLHRDSLKRALAERRQHRPWLGLFRS